jgi:hypothetical protein
MDQTMDQLRDLRAIALPHEHAFTMKRLAWWTLAITAVMGALYFLVGFPPAFDTYYAKMYFHAVGLGIAALAAYLVIEVFELEAYEPALDFPVRYRAFISVVFGALGGLVYLNRDVFGSLPDIGVLFFIVAFVLALDVAAALLVELIVLPRKKAGVYDSRSRSIVDYVGRLVPFTPADRAAYAGLTSSYWLAVASIASVCVAMVIGFINLWVRAFGPSIFGGYMAWLGLDVKGFEGATLDPHSHMIALAIIGLVVAVAMVRFGVFDGASTLRRTVARVGGWIAITGVVLTTLVLGAVAFLNFAPPTLFTSGPGDINGMAGDDLIMTIVFIGSMVVAAAILSGRQTWRNGLRLTIVGTWVATVAITVLMGFYIELNQVQFAGSLAANDASFSAAHPMTGIFLMIVLSLALLLVDFFGVAGRARRIVVATGSIGLLAAAAGTTFWTFVDPSQSGVPFALYIGGIAICYLTVLIASVAVRPAQSQPLNRSTP